jgi:hypothetical protein
MTKEKMAENELQAENEKLKSSMEWQPIETAPKDGSLILCGNKMEIAIASWSTSAWVSKKQDDGSYGAWLVFDARSDSETISPSHWMPLPDPPQIKE